MSAGNGLAPSRSIRRSQLPISRPRSTARKARQHPVLHFGFRGAIQVSTESSAKTRANASAATQNTLQLES